MNYVFVFYNAMAIFAQKHFTRRGTDLLSLLINGSIYLSAAGAIVMRFVRRALLPMLDALLVVLLMCITQWAMGAEGIDAGRLRGFAFFALITVLAEGLCGGYDIPVKLLNVVKATVLLAAFAFIYAAVSDGWEGMLYFAAAYGVAVMLVAHLAGRLLLHGTRVKPYSLRSLDRKRVLSVGSPDENKHALALLWQTHFGLGRQKQMSTTDAGSADAVDLIRKKIRKHDIDEVVFCAKDMAWGRVIELIEGLKRTGVMFKIAQPAREFIIGPSSIESLQDLDIMEMHAVNSAAGRRTKRLMDVITSSLFLLLLPISFWLVHDGVRFMHNTWNVLSGRKSWVGYTSAPERSLKLPPIKPGIIDPLFLEPVTSDAMAIRANTAYAKDYSPWQDLALVLRGFRSLGRA
ncbi:MAG: hypothetical protein IPL52_01925 [Flavobacteriales bacterium]|nr:hypothetical protein [Flavobacteriales bacterium]